MRNIVLFIAVLGMAAFTVAGFLTMVPTANASSGDEEDSRVADILDKLAKQVDLDHPSTVKLERYVAPSDEDDEKGETRGIYPALPSATILQENPYGCKGRTDDPHKSHTNPDMANVHATTYCPKLHPQPHIVVTSQLFRAECNWLGLCSWAPHGPQRSNPGQNKYSVTTNSEGPCVNNTYKGNSAHWIIDIHDDLYYAYTSRINSINNC